MKKTTSIIFFLISLVFVSVSINPAFGAPPEESWRVNCGNADNYSDPSGNLWYQDENFFSLWRWGYDGADSYAASTTSPISGTDLQSVFQTNRWGHFTYKIDVPNGTYKVTLMFAETYWNNPGQRVFDIAVEGVTLWRNVDIFAWSGGKNRAMELSATVTVADSGIDIAFPVIYMDHPLLSGIKIEIIDVSDDAFLDFIERKMFWFFWNNASPVTGLVKWGENNWGVGYSNVSSVASDGFALSIYTIGAERGWVTKEEAYQRVITMLNSFDTLLANVHGFWYHLVYMDNNGGELAGQRAGGCEISTVDSALFIQGALQAGEYFRDTHPDVAVKAEELYRRMDWTWFTNINNGDPFQNRFINMGWKPENDGYSYIVPSGKPEGGYYCNDWWNRYCESIFVDLLALGSPTYPVAYDAWRDMNPNWADGFGYHFMQEPPLFTHQYHHLYFNLTDKRDARADYFSNSQKATLANRQTCLEDSRYEAKRWGLTGCGSPPNGDYIPYGGYPGGSHDGTVAPTAAATSLMFTKDESMEAIRYMFFKYKHMIWGLHGFCDSFNVQQDFRNATASGLNNGAMIIGIENYRSGLVMNTFMRSAYANAALTAAQFVATPQVSESSFEDETTIGSYAYDGNLGTRWSSSWSNAPQWIEIDFKSPRTFNKIIINWETAYAKAYKIQISDNRINWTDICSTNSGDGGIDEIIFPAVSGRYLRVYGTERGTEWGYSIWEISTENSPDYWLLNMTEMNWYENIAPYNSTGAAVCQMILNYIRAGAEQPLLAQDTIYQYAKDPDPYDGSELLPDQIAKVLGHFDPYDYMVSNWADIYDNLPGGNPCQGYNFGVDTYDPGTDPDAMNRYMRDICHWMAYTSTKGDWWEDGELVARPNTPAAVPIYGSYNHWVAVKGYAADQNPAPDPHVNPWLTPDFTVYGLWMKDPLVTGIGQNVYVTAAECESNYFMPLATTDKYNGLLVQVAEPPQKISTAHVTIPEPAADPENLEFVGITNYSATDYAKIEPAVAAYDTTSSAMTNAIPSKQSWRDLVDKHLLLDQEAVAAFEGTIMGRPVLVKRLDLSNSDYYLVPFNKWVGSRLRTSAMIILDEADGHFKEASWVKNPETLFRLKRAQALNIVLKILLKNRYKISIRDIKNAQAELTWQPTKYSASPYKPFWRISIGDYTWYVTMEGKIFELR